MSRRAVAATQQAVKVCGACGHARIRHFSMGVPGCSYTTTQYPLPVMADQRPTTTRCACTGFTQQKGGQ